MFNALDRRRYPHWLVLATLVVGALGILPAVSARAWLQISSLSVPIMAATPVVALSLSSAVLTAPATITMKASVSGVSVTRINFYAGSTLVGSAAATPYEVTWKGAAAGTYTLTAESIDLKGTKAYSAPLQVTVVAPAATPDLRALPLVQKTSMRYQGSFRLPNYQLGASNFGYAGTFAYNPKRNSIVGIGHDHQQMVAEYAIPDILPSPTLAGLARATPLQNFADPTNGKRDSINHPGSGRQLLGGLLPWGEKLVVSAYSYYDGNGTQFASHFIASENLANTSRSGGPFAFTARAGMVGGYMAAVPKELQEALGGPAVTGQCCLAVISRSSYGPALFSFNPDDLGVTNPVKATPLVYYPSTNPLDKWDATSALFNGTTEISGVVFPKGSRSVLFFGRHGTGKFCYGSGVAVLSVPAVPEQCVDPQVASKGTHAYPYVRRVWAYDLLDLIEVKNGRRQPWAIKPYATWDIEFPLSPHAAWLRGATYDAANNRLFLGQPHGDGDLALIHVYGFDTAK